MNNTDHKIQIFLVNGKLKNTYDFKTEVEEHGKVTAISPNGKVFLFLND
jgi:hypothetical protein